MLLFSYYRSPSAVCVEPFAYSLTSWCYPSKFMLCPDYVGFWVHSYWYYRCFHSFFIKFVPFDFAADILFSIFVCFMESHSRIPWYFSIISLIYIVIAFSSILSVFTTLPIYILSIAYFSVRSSILILEKVFLFPVLSFLFIIVDFRFTLSSEFFRHLITWNVTDINVTWGKW